MPYAVQTMRLDEEEHAAGRQAGRWLDVKQAAEELGISSDAVRKRIVRETLRSAKQEDGAVWVWLDGADDRLDGDQPANQPTSWTEAGHRLDDLIDAKDDALRDLRTQLEHMRQEAERKDTIIMQLAQANATLAARVPELEAATEARGWPEMATEEADGMDAPSSGEHLSWWRRLLGLA